MAEALLQTERAIQVIVACPDEDGTGLVDVLASDRRLSVRAASDWSELRDTLEHDPCDVVILSSRLGDKSGFELNQCISDYIPDPPATVLVESTRNPHAIIKALRCGFADFVPKDRNYATELQTAVLRAADRAILERERTQRLRDLERMAQRDSVTGLVNRYFIGERLDQLVEIGRRHATPFALLLIRVAHFDQIESVFGCKVGDAVLLGFARNLRAASRKSDTFGRMGPDSFLYLLDQQVTPEGVAGACARLSEALRFSLNLDAVSLSLSASIGAASFPADGSTVAELLAAAESRMAPDPSDMTTLVSETENGERSAESADELRGPSAPMGEAALAIDNAIMRASDRRDAIRHRCLKTGVLVFNNGFSSINCLVRDLSETGARIEVEGNFDMRHVLELRLVESGQRYRVEKRWHSGNRYGLRFVA